MSSNEKKFWRSPELIESLLPFLDISSTLRLAKAHKFTLQVLQGKSSWNKFIRRTCPYGERFQNFPPFFVVEGAEQKKAVVVAQAELLKLMGTPQDLLQDLLGVTANGFPANDLDFFNGEDGARVPCLFVLCGPCQKPHSVSPFGFMLLEEIEGALGSTEQRVEKVVVKDLKGPLMSAVTNRLSRQQALGQMTGIITINVFVCTAASLDDLLVLIMNCQNVNISGCLVIAEERTAAEWAALGNALSKQNLQVADVTSSKGQMASAREEDLRAIWDAMSGSWTMVFGELIIDQFQKGDGEEAWEFLKHCWRMTDGELAGVLEEEDGDEEEDGEEDEKEEDMEDDEDAEGGEEGQEEIEAHA